MILRLTGVYLWVFDVKPVNNVIDKFPLIIKKIQFDFEFFVSLFLKKNIFPLYLY